MGTIDSPDHSLKVPNFKKLSLDISQVLWEEQEMRFCFAIALKTLWITVHAAKTETPDKSPLKNTIERLRLRISLRG